jgi:hypothetical protein
MNEEKWKKSQEIKFYIDLFSNSVHFIAHKQRVRERSNLK